MINQPKVKLRHIHTANPSSIPGGPRPLSPKATPACSPSRKKAGIMSSISFILFLLYLLFLLADCEHLRRVGGDYLVFGVGGDDFDGNVFEPRKKYSLHHIGLQQEILFFVGEVKGFLQSVDSGGRLFEEELDGGGGYHREPVGRLKKVVHVLGNGRKPEVVLAAALCHPVEEARRVVRLHHPPCLVDDQQALFEIFADGVPNVVE